MTLETTPPEPSTLVASLRKFTRLLNGDGPTNYIPSDEMTLSISEICDILRFERRQWTIEALSEIHETPVSTSELARMVGAIEYDCSPGELTEEQEKRVYISLTQSHLVRLADADVVSYDTERRMVNRGDSFASARQVYELLEETLQSTS